MFTIRPQKQTNHILCPVYVKCQEREVTAARVNIIFTKYLILLSLNTKTVQKCIISNLALVKAAPLSPTQMPECMSYLHYKYMYIHLT